MKGFTPDMLVQQLKEKVQNFRYFEYQIYGSN